MPNNCIEVKDSLRSITAPNIPVIGSRYKNKAVFVWPILGIASNWRNKAIAYEQEGINRIKNALRLMLVSIS